VKIGTLDFFRHLGFSRIFVEGFGHHSGTRTVNKDLQGNITTAIAVLAFGLALWTALMDRRRKLRLRAFWRWNFTHKIATGEVFKILTVSVTNVRGKPITLVGAAIRFTDRQTAARYLGDGFPLPIESAVVRIQTMGVGWPVTLAESETFDF